MSTSSPIASPGSSSIVVGNLSFNFTWSSSGEDAACKRTTDQILVSLRPPKSSFADYLPKGPSAAAQGSTPSSNLPLSKQSGRTSQGSGRRLKKAEKEKPVVGPACVGPSIEDLFSHSFSPPSAKPRPHTPTSRWL